jgi:hypothetical protein
MVFSSKTGASVLRLPPIDSNEDREMDLNNHNDNPTALSGPIAQFLNGMPDWMNTTPEDINRAVQSLPNPSEGHILPGILLQEAKEANAWRHIHDRHYQIMTLISYVYTISYTYIVYDIVFNVDKKSSISNLFIRYRGVLIDIELSISIVKQ